MFDVSSRGRRQHGNLQRPIRHKSRRQAAHKAALRLLTMPESVVGACRGCEKRAHFLAAPKVKAKNLHETYLLAARDDLTISRAPTDTIGASLAS